MFAFDRSLRTVDADGHLHVEDTNISKACVCPYFGREIVGAKELGLDPDKEYQLYRDAGALEEGASTFNGKPLLIRHKGQSADSHDQDLTVGAVYNVEFKSPYLKAELVVWKAESIAGIESGAQRELSCSYRYKAVMEKGEHEGVAYDGRMIDIVGNHVALVEKGRAGPDVLVSDSMPAAFLTRTENMPKIVTRKAALSQLATMHSTAAASLANDAAMLPLKTYLEKLAADAKKASDESDEKDEMSSDMDTPKLPGAAKDEKPDDQDEDESDEEYAARKKREQAADKKAKDAKVAKDKAAKDAEEDDKKKDDGKAMDSAIRTQVAAGIQVERERMAAIREAERDVRPIVGEVTVAMDSAEEIYRFALDTMKQPHDGIPKGSAPSIFKTILNVAQTRTAGPVLASDSAAAVSNFDKMFPGAVKLVRG